MKAVGITAEYNPFHHGHAWQIRQARKLTGADCCVIVMSGDFVQRGEPAAADKWNRAKTAVANAGNAMGCADLIVELPFAFACNRAENFAAGAVDTLIRLGVDCISFGCEERDHRRLREAALVLSREKETLEAVTAAYMETGLSRVKAYNRAVLEVAGTESAEVIRHPNNILAVEYLKRMEDWKQKGIQVHAVPITRIGSGYREIGAGFAGAAAIRAMREQGRDVRSYLEREPVWEKVDDIRERMFQMLKAILLRSRREELASLYGVGEGMEHKLKKEIRKATDLDDFIQRIVSRRYTAATVKRVLTYVLLGCEGNEMDFLLSSGVKASGLLAVAPEGRRYLRQLSDESFRVVTNVNKEAPYLSDTDQRHLNMNVLASDMYHALCGKELYQASDRVRKPFVAL